MPEIATDPKRLQASLDQLLAQRKRAALSSREVEALAKCAFRIAVHPSTPFARAAELLLLAMRTDKANPKYAYHLARLYFRGGDLEQAGNFLERARQHSPPVTASGRTSASCSAS